MSDEPSIRNADGFFLAYFAAEFGTSIGIFVLRGSDIIGADLRGGIYDGKLNIDADERLATGRIGFKMQQGGTTITGASSELPVQYYTDVAFKLPLEDQPYHEFETITGSVNVRFEKVRSL